MSFEEHLPDVVHERVDRPERLERGPRHRLRRRLLRDVTHDEPVIGIEFRRHPLQGIAGDVTQHEARALAGQHVRGAATDAAARAGDDHDPPVQASVRGSHRADPTDGSSARRPASASRTNRSAPSGSPRYVVSTLGCANVAVRRSPTARESLSSGEDGLGHGVGRFDQHVRELDEEAALGIPERVELLLVPVHVDRGAVALRHP